MFNNSGVPENSDNHKRLQAGLEPYLPDFEDNNTFSKGAKVGFGLGIAVVVLALAGTGVGLTAHAGTADPLTVAGSPILTGMFSAIHKGGAALNHFTSAHSAGFAGLIVCALSLIALVIVSAILVRKTARVTRINGLQSLLDRNISKLPGINDNAVR